MMKTRKHIILGLFVSLLMSFSANGQTCLIFYDGAIGSGHNDVTTTNTEMAANGYTVTGPANISDHASYTFTSYDMVFVICGDASDPLDGSAERTAIINYAQTAGSRLFITGGEVAFDHESTTNFWDDVLHLAASGSWASDGIGHWTENSAHAIVSTPNDLATSFGEDHSGGVYTWDDVDASVESGVTDVWKYGTKVLLRTYESGATRHVAFYQSYDHIEDSWNAATTRDNLIENIATFLQPACADPTTQASSPTITAIGATGYTVNFTAGNGAGRLVVMRSGSAVNADPVDGTNYTANAAFGSGTQIGSGNYVVYKGSGTSVAVTSLSPNTEYHVAIYEYNCISTAYMNTTNEIVANATTYKAGILLSGNLVINGSIVDQSATNGLFFVAASGVISGTATVITDVDLGIRANTSFDGTINSGNFDDVSVIGGNTFTVNSGKTFKAGSVTNAGTLTLTSTGSSTCSKDFVNSGTINSGSSTITFNGAVAQSVTTGAATFNNVTFNNTHASGVTLQDAWTINGVATFTDGKVTSTASNILTLGSAATVSGATDASHVAGPVKKTTAATSLFTFPIGDGTIYAALGITPSATSSTVWTAKFTNSGYTDYSIVSGDEANLNHVSQSEYWDLSRNSGAANCKVTLSWGADMEIDDYTQLLVSHFTTGTNDWEYKACTVNGGSNNTSGSVIMDEFQTSFSPFTLGSKTSANPLAIELVKFYGWNNGQGNTIVWETASEQNSDYFILESSKDGIGFQEIQNLPAAGFSNDLRFYEHEDYGDFDAERYYKLTEVDQDGKHTDHGTIVIDASAKADDEMLLTRATRSENILALNIQAPEDKHVLLSVSDVLGRVIYTESLQLGEGSNRVSANLRTNTREVIVISLYSDSQLLSKKIY